MSSESEAREERLRAGLCADCKYAQQVVSDRGASFYLCQLSFTNPSFAKYPALPVRSCAGYESKQN
ncbi:MAG: hypothetical protein ABSA32_04055 [Candidatus Acidiferrales bacterium]